MNAHSRIYVAGRHTLIGSALIERLDRAGYRHLVEEEGDLTDADGAEAFFADRRPEFVFLEHEIRTGDRQPVYLAGDTTYLGSWDAAMALPLQFGGFGPGGLNTKLLGRETQLGAVITQRDARVPDMSLVGRRAHGAGVQADRRLVRAFPAVHALQCLFAVASHRRPPRWWGTYDKCN